MNMSQSLSLSSKKKTALHLRRFAFYFFFCCSTVVFLIQCGKEKEEDTSQDLLSRLRKENKVTAKDLRRIPLPDLKNKKEVTVYVDRIISLSLLNPVRMEDDPQVGFLAGVGSDNSDILIQFLKKDYARISGSSSWLEPALQSIVTEKEKPLILGALEECPGLIKVVLKNNWIADAKEILITGFLRDPRRFRNYESWAVCVATFNDPKTYDALRDAIMMKDAPPLLASAVEEYCPELDLTETVQRAWQIRRNSEKSEMSKLALAETAARYGAKDALDYVVSTACREDHPDPFMRDYAHDLAENLLRDVGEKENREFKTPKEFEEWYLQNRENLYFNKLERKFRLPSWDIIKQEK